MSDPVRASAPQVTSVGKIQILNLAALKDRIGPKWPRMAGPVQQFFEAAIRRNLGPGDAFHRAAELTYLVVFCGLSQSETEFKCMAISEEVCTRLFGSNGAEIVLRNLIANVRACDVSTAGRGVAELDSLLEQRGREILVRKSAIPDEQHELRVRLLSQPDGVHRIKSADLGFAYRPVWDSTKHAVLTYLCQPALHPLAAQIDARERFVEASGPEDAERIDRLALEHCLVHAEALRDAGQRIILAVPVHFSTVSRPKSWNRYASAYRRASVDIQRDIAFVVYGIDAGVPHIRLVQEMPKLALNAHRVLCTVEKPEGAGTRFARTGAHGIGLSLDATVDEARAMKLIADIVREAHRSGTDAFVLGLRSRSMVLGSVDAGVRYLEGQPIRPAMTDARHAFAQGVEELYREMLRGR
jgi:hypothetical protein